MSDNEDTSGTILPGHPAEPPSGVGCPSLRTGPRAACWTPAEDATLARMRARGLSNAAVSKALGRTKAAVNTRIHTLRIPSVVRSTWSPDDDDTLRLWMERGYSHRQIAKELGKKLRAVAHRARKLGLSAKDGKWSDQDGQLLRSMLDDGASVFEISTKLNRSMAAVNEYMSGQNLAIKSSGVEYKEGDILPELTRAKQADISIMLKCGMNTEDIAKCAGLRPNHTEPLIKRYQLPLSRDALMAIGEEVEEADMRALIAKMTMMRVGQDEAAPQM